LKSPWLAAAAAAASPVVVVVVVDDDVVVIVVVVHVVTAAAAPSAASFAPTLRHSGLSTAEALLEEMPGWATQIVPCLPFYGMLGAARRNRLPPWSWSPQSHPPLLAAPIV
jgi:hypothetical protein